MGEMVGSGLRSRIRKNFIRLPMHLILRFQVIIVFKLVVVLRYRVPSLMSVELNQPYLILLVICVGSFIMDIMGWGKIGAIILVSLVIYNEIVLHREFSL